MTQVRIRSWGQRKIMAIKIVRGLTGYGLKQTKDVVESGEWFPVRPAKLDQGCAELREIGCEIEVEGQGSAPAPAHASSSSSSSSSLAPGSYVLRVMAAPRKIHAIKLVRELDGSGLKDAKEAVEQHRALNRVMSRDEAERALARFVEIGAEVRIEPAGPGLARGSSSLPVSSSQPPSFSPSTNPATSAWDDEDDYDF